MAVLTYLYTDHPSAPLRPSLGTTDYVTNTGAFLERQGYYGYGKYRTGGVLPTDNRYTGQKLDATTGLYYYGARYYDRMVGMFVSPDTLVPDPTNVWDWNRYAYGRLNPLRFNDPTGHQPQCDIATPDCQQQMSAWTAYQPYSDALPWEGFLTAYTQYNAYAGDSSLLLNDFLVDAGNIPGDQAAARLRLGAGEWYAQTVAGLPQLASLFLNSYAALEAAQNQYASANNQTAVLNIGLLMGVVFGGAELPPGLAQFGGPCSFSEDTLIATNEGPRPISQVEPGDLVLAYDESLEHTSLYTVTATLVHLDSVVVTLTIDDEIIVTTPEHPFYARAREWVPAGELQVGEHVLRVDGRYGSVQAIDVTGQPQVMYNLTVAEAHTYFVGDGQWLVHNTCAKSIAGGHA